MKRAFTAILLVLMIACLFVGCARSYWTDDKVYTPGTNGNVTSSPTGNNTYGNNRNNNIYGADGNRIYGNNGNNRNNVYGGNGNYANGGNGSPNLPIVTDNMGRNRTGRNQT